MHVRSRSSARDEAGFALVTALLATLVMLVLGLALLALVDTQARESGDERTRDQSFNLAESVLTSEAFVLGRTWPAAAPTGDPACSASGADFGDALGGTDADVRTTRLRANLDATYTDAAYTGATWRVALCDDDGSSTVWSDAQLSAKAWDANGNGRLWVRARATVRGKPRTVVGLVRVRLVPALDSRFGVEAGGLADDLGATVTGITTQGVLGGVLSGLFGTTPTVAPDPVVPASTPSGVTGVRCGVLDLSTQGPSCVTGTLASLDALPVLRTLVTGGRMEHVPGTTAAPPDVVSQLRQQAQTASPSTYVATSAGTAPGTPPSGLAGVQNPTDRASGNVTACTLPAGAGPDSVVFIEKVGGGDDYCAVDVSAARRYKALVIGSGRVVLRGNGTATAASPTATVNTFRGVVYALNLQTTATADGGLGLSDAATPGREIVRIDRGAHVRGGVYADGRSGKVGIYPPPVTFTTAGLVNALIPAETCGFLDVACATRQTLRATLLLVSSVTDLVGQLVTAVGVTRVTDALVGQLGPQRASYGAAITGDVAAIEALTVFGPSGVLPGSFRDLAIAG